MKLGPYKLNTIITGDARQLARAIPRDSIDLVFTDPIYENTSDYRWLSRTAQRVLKPNRSLLAWTVHDYLNKVVPALEAHLTYKRLLILFHSGVTVGNFVGKIFVKSTPCVWMQKGNGQPLRGLWDVSTGTTHKRKYGDYHQWAKDPVTVERWIDAFTNPGDTVLDPFTGSGVVPAVCKLLDRNFLAFEQEAKTAATARRRVSATQVPLVTVSHAQPSLM